MFYADMTCKIKDSNEQVILISRTTLTNQQGTFAIWKVKRVKDNRPVFVSESLLQSMVTLN